MTILNESNLALLQTQDSRSASPEISQEQQIAEIERECNAMARRLEREGRTHCITRHRLIYTKGRLHQADGATIGKQMATWQRIEGWLAAEFEPLPTNLVPKHKMPRQGSQAQLQQSRADESHKILTEKLGTWLNDQKNVSGASPSARLISRTPPKPRRSQRLSGKAPELSAAALESLPRRV